MQNLQKNPKAKGYIVIYGDRDEGGRDAEKRKKSITDYFRFLRIDDSRITILRGGFRENLSTEMWMAFGDAAPPLAPTVNEKFIAVPKPKIKPRSRKK